MLVNDQELQDFVAEVQGHHSRGAALAWAIQQVTDPVPLENIVVLAEMTEAEIDAAAEVVRRFYGRVSGRGPSAWAVSWHRLNQN
jgi:hypothetical protein